MLSRVANSLFWLARYLERAESTARVLAVTHSYAQDLRGVALSSTDECWGVIGRLQMGEAASELPVHDLFRKLVFDSASPSSLYSCITCARENARGIRDAISSELWETLNVLFLRIHEEAASPRSEASELSLLLAVRTASHLFQGLRDHTMVHGDERGFLVLGQFLERAEQTSRILEAMFTHPVLLAAEQAGHSVDVLHLVMTLRCCTAFEAFVRSSAPLTGSDVAAFLLLDHRFPRSVEYCVQEVGNALHGLSGTPANVFTNDAEQCCGRLVAELRFAAIEEIMSAGFQAYLRSVLGKIQQISDGIAREYFR
jgi:uncharacterized alpha-E superfamily protein